MSTPYRHTPVLRLGLISAALLTTSSLRANPISLPEKPVGPEIATLIIVSILMEAICWVSLLRRFQKPRLFVLWILGMHLVTFPAFVALLKFLETMRPAMAIALGEGLVVAIEGYLVFLICGFVRPIRQNAPVPSLVRCWLVSFAGNACSATAFPLLTAAYHFIFPP